MKKLNKRGAKRLMNVARALRESPNPDRFTMNCYIHECGTPACALGHYVLRKDLQREFSPADHEYVFLVSVNHGHEICEAAVRHFGISYEENRELFSVTGCNNAQTEAADYIENFVKERRSEVV